MNKIVPPDGAYWTAFYGCSLYPGCKGTRDMLEDGSAEDRKKNPAYDLVKEIWYGN